MIKNERSLNISRFSAKADLIARYRWPFHGKAVRTLAVLCRLGTDARVADIGSGTGALTRLLLQTGSQVFAVEPNDAMRAVAERDLGVYANFTSLAALAEATGLPRDSIDLVTVGRAMHWLPAEATRQEFARILRPSGWLAILATNSCHSALQNDLRSVQTEANGWDVAGGKQSQPHVSLADFFGGSHFETMSFHEEVSEDWSHFFGRVRSFSSAPDPGDHGFETFEREVRCVFEHHAVEGHVTIAVATELTVGQVMV